MVRKDLRPECVTKYVDADLNDVMLHSEISIPFDLLVNQNLTLGTEWNQQRMKDMLSNSQTFMGGDIPWSSSTNRSPYSDAEIFSCLLKTTWN